MMYLLKPFMEAGDRYILRIQKQEKGFLVHQNSFSSKSPISFPNYLSLHKQIHSWCKSSSYLTQETIHFKTFEEQQLDFRFLCHKKAKGKWEVVSSVARVAANQQFVANVDQGGRIEKPLTILTSLFPDKESYKIMSEMKELSLSSAHLLSESLGGNFAELGIDIGVDSNGDPWIIEINSKPSKRTYLETGRIRPSVKALYEYCLTTWTDKEEPL